MARKTSCESKAGESVIFRRLARNSAYLAGGAVASALFLMLAAVLNARSLPAHDFGLLVLFQSATMLLATLMSFATQQPVIKLGASALADGDLVRLGRIIGMGLLFDVVAAIAATAAGFAILAVAHGWIGLRSNQLELAALFAGSLLFTGYLTSNGIFRLLDRFGLLSLIQALCAAAVLAATAFLYITHAPFEAYCWAWAAFYALNGQVPLVAGLPRPAGPYRDQRADRQNGAGGLQNVPRLLLGHLGNGHCGDSSVERRLPSRGRHGFR